MNLRITTRDKADAVFVDISGKLTLGEGTNALREETRELVESGAKRIILNMADVTFIDSSGLGELVGAYTILTMAGGEVKLLNLAKRAHDLLKVTKLCTVFETFENESAAIGSFSVAPTELQLRWSEFMRSITERQLSERPSD